MNLNQIKKVDWQRIEDSFKISLYPVLVPGWSTIIKNSKRVIGKSQNYILSIHQERNATFYGSHKEWVSLGNFILKKLIKNPSWGQKVNQEIITRSKELIDFSSKLQNLDYKKKSIAELLDLYEKYDNFHSRLYHYAIIPVFLDLYHPHLSDYLNNYLVKRLKAFNASEVFGLLTTPNKSSQVQKEEVSLMKIAQTIQKDKKTSLLFSRSVLGIKKTLSRLPKIKKLIEKHHTEYCYQGYNWEGPEFKVDYFLNRLKELVANRDLDFDIKEKLNYHKKIVRRQQEYYQALRLDKRHEIFFRLACDFIYTKDFRKDALVKSYWHLDPLFKQISSRLKLNPREVRNLSLNELREIAVGKKISSRQKSRLDKTVFYVLRGKLPGEIVVGKDAQEVISFMTKKEKVKKQLQLFGQVAYPGLAKGRVVIIEHPKDILRMEKGDILVTHMTNPDLIQGMKLAGAIVTETGGITCHAAIVSRELGKPCIIGTKIATRIFCDGDMVEVNANEGIVRKIK